MKQKWLRKALLEKPETRNHARPSPPFVPNIQDVDLQYIARLCTFDRHRPRKRVNQSPINSLKLFHILGGRRPTAMKPIWLETKSMSHWNAASVKP